MYWKLTHQKYQLIIVLAACVFFLSLYFGEVVIHIVTHNSLIECLSPATILFL